MGARSLSVPLTEERNDERLDYGMIVTPGHGGCWLVYGPGSTLMAVSAVTRRHKERLHHSPGVYGGNRWHRFLHRVGPLVCLAVIQWKYERLNHRDCSARRNRRERLIGGPWGASARLLEHQRRDYADAVHAAAW